MKKIITKSLLALFLLSCISGFAQNCGPNVPTFNVNLTGSPDSVWISPNISRNDQCCSGAGNDRCLQFIITLDPAASGIAFNVYSGAMPGGALFYQINCGPPTPVGQPICLNGPGPHTITFCKPGNNANQYSITSIGQPQVPTSQTINQGCTGTIKATGFIPGTITWKLISPGVPGFYNSYLSCTVGCATTNVTAGAGYPSFVDYQVCGIPLGGCVTQPVCITSRVYFNSTLLASIAPLNPTICFGSATTTITANGAGGTPPYNYQWSTGATTQSINVGPGTYSVIIGDTSNCPPATASVTVTAFTSTITANAGADKTVCNLSPTTTLNGSVTAASGGVWSGGGGNFVPNNVNLNATYTPTAAEVAAGFVKLVLTTTGNGTCAPASDTIRINYVPFQGTLAVTPVDVSCFGGSNGTATVNVTGTATPYTYSWNTAPVQTSATATGLAPGTYTVTVKDNINCPATTTVTIVQPTQLTLSATHTNVSCANGSDGTATVTPFGGTPGYTYSWNSTPGQTTAAATGLKAGTYTVTVTDSKGCTATAVQTVTEPTVAVAFIAITNVSCNGGANGTAIATASGGTPGYTYAWVPSGFTNDSITGLPAGPISVTVTDANGCTGSANTAITQPASPLTVTTVQTNVSCFGGSTGSATVTPAGGTPGYTYSWSTSPVQTTATANNLVAGSYTVTVIDSKGCEATAIVVITEPPVLAAAINNFTNVSCFGGNDGSASVQVSGGSPGYTYSWAPSGGASSTAIGLSANSYTVTVTDSKGCVKTAIVVITQPSAALAAVIQSKNNVTCFGGNDGSANINVTGGTSPYSYIWSPGGFTSASVGGLTAGSYTVNIGDAKNCPTSIVVNITQPTPMTLTIDTTSATCNNPNGTASVLVAGGVPGYTYSWSPVGGTTNTATGLAAGAYTVTVSDASGCSQSKQAIVNNISGPTATIFKIGNVSCYGGSDGFAIVQAVGGTGPYTYSWSTIPAQLNDTATGLTAGVYTATVRDNNGCKGTVTTNPQITQPPLITFATSKTDVSCNGGNTGSATVNITGGTPGPGFTLIWTPSGGTTPTASNLTAGAYTLSITDSLGCDTTATVNITEPPVLTSTPTHTDVSCKGGSTGSAGVTPAGGTPNYNYFWSPIGATSPTVPGLQAGTYTVTTTDSKGCTSIKNITITEPASILSVTIPKVNVLCNGNNTGSATANPAGGTSPYIYGWSPSGGTGQTASNLFAGNYTVTVTDFNGCQTTGPVTITQPQPVQLSVTDTVNTFCGQINGRASVAVSGGTPSYNYSWSTAPVQTTSTATGLAAGTYTVNVTDLNGCPDVTTVTITNKAGVSAAAVPITDVSCFGGNNGSGKVNTTGGVPPFIYSWAPSGGNSIIANGLSAGDYTVTVVDSKGCDTTATVTINEPTQLIAAIDQTTDVSCFSGKNGTADVQASDGTPGYTYSWNTIPVQTTAMATNLAAGSYTVTVTDNNSCVTKATATIFEPSKLTSVIPSYTDATCNGSSTGSASVDAFGGTPGYSYEWNTNPIQTDRIAINLAKGTYSVVITDSNGCHDTSTVSIDEPSPVFTTASANDTICKGASTVISAGAAGGNGNYFYVWDNNLGAGQNQTVSPQATTTYIVTGYDLNGCAGTEDTVVVGVIKLDQASLYVGVTSPICPGSTSVVYASVNDPAAGPLTYTWNQGLPSSAGPFTIPNAQPVYYTVLVTNSCGVPVKDSAKVNFNPLPVITASVNTNVGCAALPVTFFDESTAPSGANIGWDWDFGDGNTGSGNDTITHTYLTAGTYTVSLTVTSGLGCKAATSTPVNTVTVHPVPVADFTPNPTTVFLPNAPVVFANKSVGATSYSWNFGDGSTSIQPNPQHTYLDIGTYLVTLITTNQFGCTDTAERDVIATSDIVYPTGFTPDPSGPNGGTYDNTDYSNNVFFPYTVGVTDYHLMIFNRWGELIFESFDVNVGWDGYYHGKLCQQDVYVWKAFAKFNDGRVYNKVGDVTLLR